MATSPVERITNVLTLLLETRVPLTLRQIADQLSGMYPDSGAALRGAFERDKALLRDIGVPIETEVLGGDQAGETAYRIDRARYELSGLQLDDDEKLALQMAVATIRTEGGSSSQGTSQGTAQDGVWKLGGSAVPMSTVVTNVAQPDCLPTLRSAASDHLTVTFVYRSGDRRLDPYGLLLREGFWYVIGHDHGHQQVRTYRVDRIEGDVVVHDGQVFDRPAGFDLRTAFPADAKLLGADEPRIATVAVYGPLGQVVRREFGDEAVVPDPPDGALAFRVPCNNVEAFRSWVLGLGEHAEVLDPPDVRADLVAWLRAVAS